MEDWQSILEEFIIHSGVAHDEDPPGRGSGRYAFGSGNRPHQHDWDIRSRIDKLSAANPNLKESELAAMMGIYKTDKHGNYVLDADGNKIGDTSRLRAVLQIASNNTKLDQFDELSYYDNHLNPNTGKHYTNEQIAKLMGLPSESSVRSLRKTMQNGKTNKTNEIADILRKNCDEKGYIDVTSDIALYLDTASGSLNSALHMLEEEGYKLETIYVKQIANPEHSTTFRVLCPPGSENDTPIYKHPQDIKMITTDGDYENDIDSALIRKGMSDPPQVSLDRIEIRYDEDGGTERDGLIHIRAVRDENGNLVAACPDLSLGNARYGQVRIAVEGDRYIKGMAVYDENLTGADILVNSNKSQKGGIDKALKHLEENKDGSLATNIFGSAVVQTIQRDSNGNPILDKDGNQIQSAINFVGSTENDMHVEGHWGTWSKNLSPQFLTKQSVALVKSQLKQQSNLMEEELEELNTLNNPTVKRKMLIDYGDRADAKAVEMKAAPIPGQKTRVLIPEPSVKDNECYAPGLENGTTVALVRFPHAGPWEIPILTVNNNNAEAKRLVGDGSDVVVINHHNHGVLSGADSDGDTAVTIPMTRKNSSGEFEKVVDIRNMPSLNGYTINTDGSKTTIKVSDFDPTAAYSISNARFSSMVDSDGNPTYTYFKTTKAKGKEMGKTTNLIMDMQLKGCSDPDELARVDMYSMVVIDAQKHKLNYKQAAKDFGIDELKAKYQAKASGGRAGGASTLLTKAGSPSEISRRGLWRDTDIDADTGEKIYREPTYKTEKKAVDIEKVAAPAGYVWTDSNGKSHKTKYMKNTDGSYIQATYDGKIVTNKDGTYSYDSGSGKGKWVYKDKERKESIPALQKAYMEGRDATSLLSDHPSEIEQAYATYANHMHALANKARKQALAIKDIEYNKDAAKEYSTEVKEMRSALKTAKMNAPRERQAQLLARSTYNARIQGETDLDADKKRKIRGQELSQARKVCNANKTRVTFTERQWEAINKGAIPPSILKDLLDNADKDNYTSLALPKKSRITDAKKQRIKQLFDAGWSYEQIAENIGVSSSSVSNVINE